MSENPPAWHEKYRKLGCDIGYAFIRLDDRLAEVERALGLQPKAYDVPYITEDPMADKSSVPPRRVPYLQLDAATADAFIHFDDRLRQVEEERRRQEPAGAG